MSFLSFGAVKSRNTRWIHGLFCLLNSCWPVIIRVGKTSCFGLLWLVTGSLHGGVGNGANEKTALCRGSDCPSFRRDHSIKKGRFGGTPAANKGGAAFFVETKCLLVITRCLRRARREPIIQKCSSRIFVLITR